MNIEHILKINSPLPPSKRTVVHVMYSGDYVLNKINAILKPFELSSQQYNVLRILNKTFQMLKMLQKLENVETVRIGLPIPSKCV